MSLTCVTKISLDIAFIFNFLAARQNFDHDSRKKTLHV
jgi:hypothetical protein